MESTGAFNAIKVFISDSAAVLPGFHALEMYNKLISKTTPLHKYSVEKHLRIFKEYVVKNREAIVSQEHANLDMNITYSQKVFVPVKALFSGCKDSDDERRTLWMHLLLITAHLDPTSGAKVALQKLSESVDEPPDESKIMTDFKSAIGDKVFDEVVGSNLLDETMEIVNNRMQDNPVNIDELMTTAQQMLGQMANPEMKGQVDPHAILNMLGMTESDVEKLVSKVGGVLEQNQNQNQNQTQTQNSLSTASLANK